MSETPRPLTVEGAHELLVSWGMVVSIHQVRRWAAANLLPFYRLGNRLYIHEDELRAHLDRLQQDAIAASQPRRQDEDPTR